MQTLKYKTQKKNYYELNKKRYKITKKYKHQPKWRATSNLCQKHGTTTVLKLQTKELEKKREIQKQ